MTEYIIIKKQEILDNPNDYELGRLIRLKYLKSIKNEKCPICGEEKKFCDNK